ncbi:type II CRISPR RNA-guided endonuclease Cas9, partial [bacterium]|nr:type II CRISPR RNA-guided endonuclease Cas9 [bacterium]
DLLREVRAAIASGNVTLPEADAISVSQRLPYAFCYFLRYFCAKFNCPPRWYGRAFLHMARFRGFSYQLKSREEVESEASKNKDSDIKGERLKEKLEKEGKLLAEEFIGRCLEKKSISGNRFISRFSLMDEFVALRKKFLECYPEKGILFSPSERSGIYAVLFKQRGIRVKRSTIGRCSIFPNSERASKLLPEYQEFKVRQALANIRVFGAVENGMRGLDTLEKEKLYAAISTKGKISKNDFSSLIGLKQKKADLQISSNFDEMKDHLKDELQLVINEVFRADEQTQAVADIFRDGVQRRELACTLLRFNNQEAAIRFLEKRFSLTADQAIRALTAKKPDGRASYSAKALKFFIEELKRGVQPHEIRNSLGSRSNSQSLNKLIPVINAFPQLRDPAVVRVLSQVRAVVNELISIHGKPTEIRIELARSQKLSTRERQAIDRLNKSLKQEREEIAAWLGQRDVDASDTNVLRFRLWRESSHQCLYCGCMLSFNQVFASNQSQIDHIWPYSRTLDDRYINKLLVCASCNLEKGNATPFEKWGSNSEKWRQITSRFDDWVEKKVKTDDVFRDLSESLQNLAGGNRISVKRKRVLETKSDIVEGFLARQLHTTGYASRLARDYLGLLYGEQNSVKVSSGFITARYRFALRERFAAEVRAQLPNLLDHSAQKTRNDHRHHAFDAIFIALSDDRARMALQREWANGEKNPIPPPWEGFGSDLAAMLREITPSLFFPQRDAARISGKAGVGGQRSRGQLAARGALHD